MPPTPPSHIVCVSLNSALDHTFEVRRLRLGQHAHGRLLSTQPAGKAVNVARILQTLGRSCTLTGLVGEAERTDFERSFDPALVRVRLLGVPVPTRRNVTLIDAEENLESHIRDLGPEIPPAALDSLADELSRLAASGVWMIFAGSLPRGLSPQRFQEMLSAVARRGSRIALDSSGPSLDVIRRQSVWLIKPNREELAALTGQGTADAAAIVRAARSLSVRAEVVLASAGSDGCFLIEGDVALHARLDGPVGPIVCTVGAGDALLAGYLAALADGLTAEDALRQAVAAATSACLHPRAGEIDAAQAAAFAPRVRVESCN
jgi:1-phosphofructokinase